MERLNGSVEISPHCQRCGSTNTKFCYYNNYSLTQPRYFCRGCRRYWTKGGSLRNVPVRGGCRKSRRGRSLAISRLNHHNRTSFKDHLASSTGLHPSSVVGGKSFGSVGSSVIPPTATLSGPNIDLAAVYANYLKQEPKLVTEPAEVADRKAPAESHNFELTEKLEVTQTCQGEAGQTAFPSTTEKMFRDRNSQSIIHRSGIEQATAAVDHLPFELPPLPSDESLLFFQTADWFGSQFDGSNELSSAGHILPDQFHHENHDINRLVNAWSPFDFPI